MPGGECKLKINHHQPARAPLFFEPNRTAYDLNFSLLGVPVRVHPGFWLFSALFGWSFMQWGFEYLLIWIGCAFVSVLIHELGHVWAGQLFGSPGHIILYGMGGLAVGSSDVRGRWRRVIVYAAGPVAEFLYLAIILVVLAARDPSRFEVIVEYTKALFDLPFDWAVANLFFRNGDRPDLLNAALLALVFMNLFWAAVNLVPVWPLDGGRISREFFAWLVPGGGLRYSLGLSFLLGAVLAVHAVMAENDRPLIPYLPLRGMYAALLFGVLAVQSFLLLQEAERNRRHRDDGWERDPDLWR